MKKILIGGAALGAVLIAMPMFAAFEAHVVNVTATIENALSVDVKEIEFGTVFPQEALDKTFGIALSGSFRAEDRVDDVDYFLRQKPKCGLPIPQTDPIKYSTFGQVTEDGKGNFVCKDEGYALLPLLCPYLSKHEITDDGIAPEGENDGDGLSAFHGPITLEDWTLPVAKSLDVLGHLAKEQEDFNDTWNIDLKVPCFLGQCAQDWPTFVATHNRAANPDDYKQPQELEHQLYGCDLWVEVGRISLPGLCEEEIDLMLVLDKSESIDAGELTTLKTAANAFVTTLAPTPIGTHIGQSSFNTTGSLDLHLTGVEASAHAAINALTTSGLTNLSAGLDLAKAELDDLHVHERPAVQDVIVVVTDGNPNVPGGVAAAKAVATASATAAKAAGAEIFVVGIGGDVDATFLQNNIATSPSHYFAVAQFSDLQVVLENIAKCQNGENKVTVGANNTDWQIVNFDEGVGDIGSATTPTGTDSEFVSGIGTPPNGTGSLNQFVGTDGNDASRIITSLFNGTPLASLTDIRYSTYTDAAVSDQAVYLQMRIDKDGNGTTDDRLFFEPVYQSGGYELLGYSTVVPDQCSDPTCVINDMWQIWDADAGGWWSVTDSAGGPPITTLAGYLTAYPGAKLATDLPAFRIQVGGGAGAWDNFVGYMDNLIVNGVTYDFEL